MRLSLVLAILIAATGAVWSFGPIAQDQAYHAFADTRTCLGCSNGGDVFSNLPFLFVGVWGLRALGAGRVVARAPWERRAWAVLFTGIALTAFGSAYYHLAPDDARLAWDRYPMTLVFTSLTALLVGERVSEWLGRHLLWPLVLAGVGSVALWRYGNGDLRLYATLHYVPLAGVPLLLWLFPRRYTRALDLLVGGVLYGLANATEALDGEIFEALGVVSGHTLKHLFAAACTAMLVVHAVRRKVISA